MFRVHFRDGFYTCVEVMAVCEVCMLYQKAHEGMTEPVGVEALLLCSSGIPLSQLCLGCPVTSTFRLVTPPPSVLPSSLSALPLFDLSISPVVSQSVHLLSILSLLKVPLRLVVVPLKTKEAFAA